ncbi:MAG: glycosyltransferase family 2 protein [Ignavibacteria bacterium]|nr:glycosyltransferase family 2 protein [Ignavibacteria bacterium]
MEELNYKYAIIILHWGNISDTIECLDSIDKYCLNYKYFVVLVDNTGNNCSLIINQKKFSFKLHIINSSENLGFAAGNNIGIKFADKFNPENYILINNDTVFINNDLDRLINIFDKNTDYGIMGLNNYYYDYPDIVWQAGIKINFTFGITKVIKKVNNNSSKITEVDNVTGSALLIRRNVIERIGLLNEEYFNYWEETEWCYLAKKNGFKVGLPDNLRILHKKEKKIYNSNPIHNYFILRNKLFFFRNKIRLFFIAFLFAVIKAFIIAVISEINGNKMNIRAFYYAIKDYLSHNMRKGNLEKIIK